MIRWQGYRFRLKPTAAEAALLTRFVGCSRFVWNELVAQNQCRYEHGEKRLDYSEMCGYLVYLKGEYPFLREAYSKPLQQTIRDLATAYRRALAPGLSARFPRFKKRGRRQGIRFPQGFRVSGSGVYLPNDRLHKATTTVSKNHALVVMEDLRIVNMTASSRGTLNEPGTNVRAKTGLNRRILDQGWGEFRRQLRYKLEWNGGALLLVNPRETSRICARCGCAKSENRRTQATFQCVACGHAANADTNAAINILRRAGQARIACGDSPLGESAKQEARRVA